jgi:probable phosphoglycerate mutase
MRTLFRLCFIFLFFCSTLRAEGQPSEHKTTFLLIRHGQTDGNLQNLYIGGKTDVPLNETGTAQASQLATYLREHHSDIGAIYASDLERAYATAQKTAGLFNLQITQRSALREIDFGAAEGLPGKKVQQLFPQFELFKQTHPLRKQWWNFPLFPEGESYQQLVERVQKELQAINAMHPGEKVAIFVHGRLMRTLITETLDLPELISQLSNCEIAHFVYCPETGSFTFLQLEEALPPIPEAPKG